MEDEITPTLPPAMSLRDWFAGQALAGLLAAGPRDGDGEKVLAEEAYWFADDMMKARQD